MLRINLNIVEYKSPSQVSVSTNYVFSINLNIVEYKLIQTGGKEVFKMGINLNIVEYKYL